jgi:hypothetical protein
MRTNNYALSLIIKVLQTYLLFFNKLIEFTGLIIIRRAKYLRLEKLSKFYFNDPFLQLFKMPELVLKYIPLSQSQIRQDLFVLSELNFKRFGFFVEIGGGDGINGSNTFLMEKYFDWKGIISEPGLSYSINLNLTRNCVIDNRLVYNESNLLLDFEDSGEGLSTITKYANLGIHGQSRKSLKNTQRKFLSVSLNDLLKEANAPRDIDYISIDTEGSEFEIISKFNFDDYNIRIFTIEHNFEIEIRSSIFNLMQKNGYSRVFENISHQDDWYIKN